MAKHFRQSRRRLAPRATSSAYRPLSEPLEERQLLSNIFTVTNTLDDGSTGSLRWAITQVDDDTSDSAVSPDQIEFDISQSDPGYSGGVWTIAPTAALPAVTNPVVIDGYTQPGAQANTQNYVNTDNAVFKIVLSGAAAPGGANGLELSSNAITVHGFVINQWSANGSGAGGAGVRIDTTGGDVVAGNNIGTDATGTNALGNANGIWIEGAPGNTIGGMTGADRNLISGNRGDGLVISHSVDNVVEGNAVGSNTGLTLALPNEGLGAAYPAGILLDNAASNQIGSDSSTGGANIVVGSDGYGLLIAGTGSSSNLVMGNNFGGIYLDSLGLGNALAAVALQMGANHNTIGATGANGGNSIGGSAPAPQLQISGAGTSDNAIEGNTIGNQFFANPPGEGVLIDSGATDNTIGGTAAGAGNTIAMNTGQGVVVTGDATVGDAIEGNSIFGNVGLGIDLGGTETPLINTPGGPHVGPNDLQNAPVLDTFTVSGNQTTITGSLNSTPNQTFDIEFFTAPPYTSDGPGQVFLGRLTNVTTDANGDASFSFTYDGDLTGRPVTATATDASGDTSEFSQEIPVTTPVTADLGVSVISAPSTVTVGETVTFDFRITNYGPDGVLPIFIADTLPPGLADPRSSNPNANNIFYAETYIQVVDSGTLFNGQSLDVEFTATATTVGTFSDTLQIGGTWSDTDPGNNAATASFTVQPVATTTTLSADSSVALTLQPVTFTAVVTEPSGSETPTDGTIRFAINGMDQPPVPVMVVNGTAEAKLVIPEQAAGQYQITARYSGDATLAPSDTSAISLLRLPSNANVTLTASHNPSQEGQAVTLEASVAASPVAGSASAGALPLPGGYVDFLDGNTTLARVPLDATGHARFLTSALALGANGLTAFYEGGPTYGSATSQVTTEVVNPAPAPTVLSVQPYGDNLRSVLVVYFSAPLDPIRAHDAANYQILGPGRRRIGIDAIGYQPNTDDVALFLNRNLVPRRRYRLTVDGTPPHGITDVYGNLLDGASTGHPGSNYVTTFTPRPTDQPHRERR